MPSPFNQKADRLAVKQRMNQLRDRVLMPVSKVPPVPAILSRLVCGDMLPPFGSLIARGR